MKGFAFVTALTLAMLVWQDEASAQCCEPSCVDADGAGCADDSIRCGELSSDGNSGCFELGLVCVGGSGGPEGLSVFQGCICVLGQCLNTSPDGESCSTAAADACFAVGNATTVIDDPACASSCQEPRPDLLPIPITPGDLCNRSGDGGSLVVRVKNQGLIGAPASTTRVTFSTTAGAVTRDLATVALPSGAYTDVEAVIPPGCFDSDCNFTIEVDANDAIPESNEANNVASGLCLG